MKKLFVLVALFVFGISAFGQVKKTDEKPLAPAFKGITLEGKTIDFADLRGKVVVLNLWFINCPNCIEEINLLNKVVDDNKNNNDVVFIGLASNTKPELEKFLKKNPFKYQIIPGAGEFMLFKYGEVNKKGEYHLGYPTHVVVDREGRIVLKVEGLKGVEAVKSELKKQFATNEAKTK